MSVNSSSSSNAYLPYSLVSIYQKCMDSTAGAVSLTAFTVTDILLILPLCIQVIYLGLQRWQCQRSGAAMSHSDIFTYHMVAMELICVLASILCCCGIVTHLPVMATLGIYLFSINTAGQQFFHILTCVERYLAVVHPVTYLGLKKAKGIRIRNITVGCVWLQCFTAAGLMSTTGVKAINITSYCLLAFILIVVSFCSLTVLRVLIRRGPGEQGGDRERVDQSKQRAFYTIMAILGALLMRFVGVVVCNALFNSEQQEGDEKCIVFLSMMWLGLPSSLVLPLLFLHRAGKLEQH